ncbi:hypothetical protein HGB07_00810 [Candidatus Roizmanbacteria bacterium]|nr:hypothetical protein [Candidatus Roizmanbacteria bacterium]
MARAKRNSKIREIIILLFIVAVSLIVVLFQSVNNVSHLIGKPKADTILSSGSLNTLVGTSNITLDDGLQSNRMNALVASHLHAVRFNVYGYYDYGANKVIAPSNWDAFMKAAYTNKIKPLLLFEYYGSYANSAKPLGGYQKWYTIGHDYAKRFGPNGDWAKENGISDWDGITVYEAINEPENENSIDKNAYHEALRGLADGVHSIDSSYKVGPGGWMAANAWNDYTLRGFGTAIADLLKNGTLNFIDLHTYFDRQWAPLENTYENSSQHDFDQIKQTLGFGDNVLFVSTENLYQRRLCDETTAAQGELTSLWDTIGVVNASNKSIAIAAYPYSLFEKFSDTDCTYGLNTSMNPFSPTASGKVVALVADKMYGMNWVSLDPRGKGEFVLEGNSKKMWVWQDRTGWTNHPGTSYTLNDSPLNSTKLEVYGWDGLRKTINLSQQSTYTITQLPGNETYMFIAYGNSGIPVSATLTPTPKLLPTQIPSPKNTVPPVPSSTSKPTATSTPVQTSGSTLRIYAAGTPYNGVYPTMQLSINGKVVATYPNVKGNPYRNIFQTYTYVSRVKLVASQIRIGFTNDAWDGNQSRKNDRDLRVSKIVLDGVTYETASSSTYGEGTGKGNTRACLSGYNKSEWLYCNGFFQYANK